MARPAKNNADYFSHDKEMRNHRKVKALRVKFGPIGYCVWSMFLEVLTGSEGNRWEENELEQELLAGDFGVSVTEIRSVLNYCVSLELLYRDNGKLYSKTLDDRLKSVYEKRDLARKRAGDQARNEGKFHSNADPTDVSVTEMPQIKLKESKEEENKENTKESPADGGTCPPDSSSSGSDSKKAKQSNFKAPTQPEVIDFLISKYSCSEQAAKTFAEQFWSHYDSNGWKVGKAKMVSWHSAITGTWKETREKIFAKYPVSISTMPNARPWTLNHKYNDLPIPDNP